MWSQTQSRFLILYGLGVVGSLIQHKIISFDLQSCDALDDVIQKRVIWTLLN